MKWSSFRPKKFLSSGHVQTQKFKNEKNLLRQPIGDTKDVCLWIHPKDIMYHLFNPIAFETIGVFGGCIGVLLFELLAGDPPFSGQTQGAMFANILTVNIKWPQGFPNLAKDLVKQMLSFDPKKRPSLDKILKHPWL